MADKPTVRSSRRNKSRTCRAKAFNFNQGKGMSDTETTLDNEDVNVEAEQAPAEKPEYDVQDLHRNNIEDAMAARRSQQLNDESTLPSLDAIDDNTEEEAEEQDGQQQADPPQGRSASEQPTPKTEASSKGDDLHTLIIDGEEERKPLAEVLKLAQKSRAADKRFQDAAAALRQANELKLQFEQQQQMQPQPQAPVQEQQPVSTNDDDAVVNALMYGDETQVREAVTQLRGSGQGQQQLNPNQVAQMTAAIVREQTEHQTALNNALTEYPEIKEDPNLQSIAVNFVNQGLKEDLMSLGYTEQQLNAAPIQSWWERHREARQAGYGVKSYQDLLMDGGAKTRSWYNGRSDGQTDGLADKQNRKAGTAKQPRKVSAATPSRGTPRPKTQSEIIREEREARNLPIY